MRLSKLAPAAALFSLFTLTAHAADLSALTGALSSALGGAGNSNNTVNANSASCQQQIRDLQTNINAANAKGDTLRATAFQAALTQTNKSCSNSTYNTQAQVDTNPQRQQNVNKAADAINAIGGLFK
ncbi:DUF1090 family protein [Pseudomonas sp. NPDC087814]|jgi:hypothetical protein|uniref:DUF1090 family protein n=1 Tax=unclassified Pseudomonas TaxID=196821 RepID=UPI0015A35734|nr:MULTISPECIES: DUF1090 family protein [unclassified Pseudomonas]MDQ0667796.1 small-conductance mechanosensitive channel [Pseudomonas sp. W2I6]NWB11217.1 DUF1090 family protein [Pseudomonas sp. D5002]NWB61104.1 DUF1090 family protein [Pseudomonas sp. F1002]NWB73960.1 DUF1090 family protein [Pseudomonas sp. G5001]NWC02790.1 DUF1090 family protein [Pseudomonas sp. G1002]